MILEENDFQDVPVLIFANKQDLDNSLQCFEVSSNVNGINNTQISDMLKLESIIGNREWQMVGCSALDDTGLEEGFKWIMDTTGKS